jgi:hypothetical protein
MEKIVHKYLTDTARIAHVHKRNTLDITCYYIYIFFYKIQYKLDKRGLEQLRIPARSWEDRRTGVDCDFMNIFISIILTSLKIPHSLRITRYSADHWQHVYVIVPDNRDGYINIDAVVFPYGYEKHFTDKMDYNMSLNGIHVAVLSGLNSDLKTVVTDVGLSGFDLGATTAYHELYSIYRHLVATQKSIADNPKMVSHIL